ncbi:MAG: PRC-barrel domain-containing protein [Hyphomicrobiaceae bacterium]
MCRRAKTAALAILLSATAGVVLANQPIGRGAIVLAASSEKPASESASQETKQLSPEEKMQRRFPQPARVGDLIGLPLLDDDDRTLGHIRLIVRNATGKLQLIVTHGGILGWPKRLVAVPIEVVAIAGRQLAALDMTRAEFEAAPTWDQVLGTPVALDEVIRIGLYKR